MNKIQVGDHVETHIAFSQDQVEEFRQRSGDTNTIHTDPQAAERSAIGSDAVRSVHGMHAAMIFTQILGTQFPGDGTVYRSIALDFDEPVLVDTDYVAEVRVLSVDRKRHRARLLTIIREAVEPARTVVYGTCLVVHNERL